MNRAYSAENAGPCRLAALAVAFAAVFVASPVLAVTRTWDGGGNNNNWTTAANWSGNVVPGVNDEAVFNGTSNKACVIDTGVQITTFTSISPSTASISISDGSSFRVNSTFALSSGTLTTGISPVLMYGHTFSISADAVFNSSSTTQFVSASTVTLSGYPTFYALQSTVAGKRIQFTAGSTVTVTSEINFVGTLLRSSTPGSTWYFDFMGAKQTLTGISVQDSNAIGTLLIADAASVNLGNNTNWVFFGDTPGMVGDMEAFSASQIGVRWKSPLGGASVYEVRISSWQVINSGNIASVPLAASVASSSSTVQTTFDIAIGNLIIGQTYNVAVRARRGAGPWSPIATSNGHAAGTFRRLSSLIPADLTRATIKLADYSKDGTSNTKAGHYVDVAVSGTLTDLLATRVYRYDTNLSTFEMVEEARDNAVDPSIDWLDADQDGDLDLMIFNSGLVRVIRNLGAGNPDPAFSDNFSVVSPLSPVTQGAIAAGDADNDGDTDFALIGKRFSNDPASLRIAYMDGDRFRTAEPIESTTTAFGYGSVAWGDADNCLLYTSPSPRD